MINESIRVGNKHFFKSMNVKEDYLSSKSQFNHSGPSNSQSPPSQRFIHQFTISYLIYQRLVNTSLVTLSVFLPENKKFNESQNSEIAINWSVLELINQYLTNSCKTSAVLISLKTRRVQSLYQYLHQKKGVVWQSSRNHESPLLMNWSAIGVKYQYLTKTV